jgi:hypothetical protein
VSHFSSSAALEWLNSQRAATRRLRDSQAAAQFRWSIARVVAFMAAFVAWRPLGHAPWLAGAAFAGCLVLFAACVGAHRRRRSWRESLDRELLVLDESASRLGAERIVIRSNHRPADAANLATLLDGGLTWELTGQERDDLDLYGAPVGLFGLLNRCSTPLGAQRLRDAIERLMLDPEPIARRQNAVRWLAERHAARLRLVGALAVFREAQESFVSLIAALRNASPLRTIAPVAALRAWSVLAGIGIVGLLVQLMTGRWESWAPLATLLLVNAGVYLPMRRRLREALDPWIGVRRAAEGYLHAARQAAHDLPDDGDLGVLRGCFTPLLEPRALPAVLRRAAWSEHGGPMHELFNWFFLFDIHVADGLLRHVWPIRDELLTGLSAIADLETILSLALAAFEEPDACFPRIDEAQGIYIREGRHPLLAPRRAVRNSLELTSDARTWVVTGSNMAGKSTFLRMCGVNVLLAQIGAAVPAAEMRWRPARLITDLRARDSLTRSESYFLAEVRNLRRMIDPPPDAATVFGLIDEPLRGTNSQEKLAASLAIVEHLAGAPHFYLVATHDAALPEAAARRGAVNHHFREDLRDGALVFDYRLRPGPATTRNALLVLGQENYPEELLARARRWMQIIASP